MSIGTTSSMEWLAGPSSGVTDVLQNGTSVVENRVARVTVPTKTSDLQNDSGFITSGDIPAIPTKTSELQNDSGFVTSSAIPTKTSDLQNDSGFVTAGDIRQLPGSTSADEGKVLTVDSNGDPQWEEPSGGTVTDVQVDGVSVVTDGVAEITMPTVPTKTSELQNDSGYITAADLPTVNDGTLTIQKNGTTIDTFTANSSSNKTVDIYVPTKTSDLTNDSGFVTSGDLPTVNDGTLTIQKNGTTIDTFTANSSSNKTVDISVPTKTSDLTNDSGFITSSDIPAAPVSDVQVDGVSVVTAGVANITLPTVNDGTLTIQKNGTTIDTFTANSSANKTVDISVPTKTSDLTNDSGFITSSSLPTVNDGTLTIQKNGTTVDTFTANASSNKTVNITVPTNTSDLTNDSGFITSGDIPAQVQSDWTENDSTDPAYIQNKPTTTPLVAGANITISDTQNGVVVAADETVLYDCSNNYVYGTNSVTLSESYKNFEVIKILNSKGNVQFYYPANNQDVALFTLTNMSNGYLWLIPWTFTSDTVYSGATGKLWTVGTTTSVDVPNSAVSQRWIQPIKIIGINRVASA